MSAPRNNPPSCNLVAINLSDPSEYEELRQQRITCGWDYNPEKFALWQKKQEEGLKSFFWIIITTEGEAEGTERTVRAGHISLDSYASPPDPELASEDKSNLTIQSFFILPQYRRGGLGRATMGLLESLATQEPYGSPNCQYITLNTLSKRYYYEDSPVGQYIRDFNPICNEEWYERQGYVAWKEEPRYDDEIPDGTRVRFIAAFMRKKAVP